MLSTTVAVILWILIAICLIISMGFIILIILNSFNKLIRKSPPALTDSATGAEKYFHPIKERYGGDAKLTYTEEEKAAALAEYREQLKKKQAQNELAAASFNAANKLI